MGSLYIKESDAGYAAWHVGRPNRHKFMGQFEYRGYTWCRLGSYSPFIYIPGSRPYVTQDSLQMNTQPEHTASIRWVMANTPGLEYVS